MNREAPVVGDAIRHIRNELAGIYPAGEIRGFTELIFEHLFKYSKTDLLIHNDTKLSNSAFFQIEDFVRQLKHHKPVQYILGEAWFYGLKLEVNPRVLIPRQETEELVRWIIEDTGSSSVKILDIGTGSGCIAIALDLNLPLSDVEAFDKSAGAVEVASGNAARTGASVSCYCDDILNPVVVNTAIYDIIVSNPPYVTVSERLLMDRNVLCYEPVEALFVPDSQALIYYEAIAGFGRESLKEGGRLYLEINEAKHGEVLQLLKRHLYRNIELKKDINGKYRMVKAVI